MNGFRDGAVRVRVPATSANLGPGFDALGLALGRYDEVTARVTASGLSVDVSGEGDALPRDETHLVVRAMRATFDRMGGQPPGLSLSCTNRIPHGRGLGSSAAAIVSGVLAARALVPGGDDRLPDTAAFALAADLEGHPDNVAAALLGGLTLAWTADGTAHAVRADVVPDLRPVAFVPPFESGTAQARALLPATVPHADAAFTAGRSGLLVALLSGAVPATTATLLDATDDRLHQPYRTTAQPGTGALITVLREIGIAALMSGAGPTVLALTLSAADAERALEHTPSGWAGSELPVAGDGARVQLATSVPERGE